MDTSAITAAEWARRLGISRQAVSQWIQHTPDFYPSRLAGGTILLTEADRQRILARPRKPVGRPKAPPKEKA